MSETGHSPHSHRYSHDPVEEGHGFSNKEIRQRFIAKVYTIVSLQLILTTIIASIILFTPSIKKFFEERWWLILVFSLCTLVICCCFCIPGVSRCFPINIILLTIFTVFESLTVGAIVVHHEINSVVLAFGISAVIVIIVTLIAWCAPCDITGCGALLCLFLFLYTIVSGAAVLIVWAFDLWKSFHYVHLIISIVGLGLFMLYLVYDTQRLVREGPNSLGPEDYIAGALSIYIDIIQIFLFTLNIVGSGDG